MSFHLSIVFSTLLLASTSAFVIPCFSPSRLGSSHKGIQLRVKPSPVEEAATLKAQAERIRLEAAKMDSALTLKKIASIEKKLNDSSWLEKHSDEKAILLKQLVDLQNKLEDRPPTGYTDTPRASEKSETPRAIKKNMLSSADVAKGVDSVVAAVTQSLNLDRPVVTLSSEELERRRLKAFPIGGFDQKDLDLYIPVAREIEAMMTNATMAEKLVAFREQPNLQEHFQAKIQALLVKPIEDMAKLDDLKKQYFSSRSRIEKESIKREMDRLEESYENDSPIAFAHSIYRGTPPMSEQEMELRLKTMGELPQMIQDLFKRRTGVESGGSLRLAIELEHFEQQIQLLDQIRFLAPLDSFARDDAINGFESMPESIRQFFCKNIGLAEDSNATTVISKLENGAVFGQLGSKNRVVAQGLIPDLPEYNDIDFVDRSRYAEEFIPAFTRMEDRRPTPEQLDTFINEVLSKKTFTLKSKPERVLGGYYLRGKNQFESGEGIPTAGDKLVSALNDNLSKSSLVGVIQFFYILDPTPPSDEEIEQGGDAEPILLVTTVDADHFYKLLLPRNKFLISASGFLSAFVLALSTCELNGFNYDQFNAQLEAYKAGTGDLDISWLTDMAAPVAIYLVGIQMAHELSHRLVAWKDKFDICLPSFIPSVQLGLTGAITSFKSPPPNFKSMFDFSIVGPLSGMALSLVLLVNGLGETIHMDMAHQAALPALPIGLLRASALGGGLVEMFLGNGVLDSPNESVLPLSPLAIAGFLGLITNALALLPLGHTDGGRIAVTMLGRRGTFVIKSITTLLLCAIGLFGFDSQEIFLVYVFFVTIWQRELESPIQNEVDELDFGRCCIGIAAALLVALTLLPHT